MQINNQIKVIKDRLSKIPNIKLRCKKCNGSFLWYERGSGSDMAHYISKKNRKYAEELAYYTFASEYLEELINVKARLEDVQEAYDALEGIRKKYLYEKEGFAELLSMNYSSEDIDVAEWVKGGFEGSSYKGEEKKLITLDGHRVRSKSEVMIADLLFEYGIPYRYENPIELNGKTLFPDFTIMRLSDKKMYYWEHFGMMDVNSYSAKTSEKLSVYMANGILPSHNLITSFEDLNNPLSSVQIRKLIEMYSLAE